MAARLMHGLRSALRRGWHQGGDALHPDPRPALRDTYLATAHTVTQVTQDAERMVYPQCRARLLRMAAEDRGHVTWLRATLLARGGALPTGACPPTVAPTSGAALRREMAAGFRRLRAATQQHRAALLEMLVQSDPSTLARDPVAGHPADALSLPMSPSAYGSNGFQ
jgi:hypothetical protein